MIAGTTASAFSFSSSSSASREHGAAAVVSVLTQPSLLALVVSFQRGLPVATGPRIVRYLRAHLQLRDHGNGHGAAPVASKSLVDLWDTPSGLLATHRWKPRDGLCHTAETILEHDRGNTTTPQQLRHELTALFSYTRQDTRRANVQRRARTEIIAWLDDERVRDSDSIPARTRLTTLLNPHAASAWKWRERVTMEAVVLDGGVTFDTLEGLLRQCLHRPREPEPERAVRRCVHRAWEAAAARGRVDILSYLYATHASVVASILDKVICSAAALAVRHGHTSVLEWLEHLEMPFEGAALAESLRAYEMNGPVACGDREVVRWMAQRTLGVMPARAAMIALAQGDLAMLREVVAFHGPACPHLDDRQGLALATFANATHQLEAVWCMIQHGCAFPIKLIHEATARRDWGAIELMLDKLDNAHGVPGRRAPSRWLIFQLVRHDDAHVLEMIRARVASELIETKLGASVLLWAHTPNTSEETMRVLLDLSPIADMASVLLTHAIRSDTARVETMLALVDRTLPPEVVAFVHRVTTDTLGPLASLARTYKEWAADAHLLATMAHWMPAASRQDARDLVVHLLPRGCEGALQRVLAVDTDRPVPHCDLAFLELCLSLRQSVYHRQHDGVALALSRRRRQ